MFCYLIDTTVEILTPSLLPLTFLRGNTPLQVSFLFTYKRNVCYEVESHSLYVKVKISWD